MFHRLALQKTLIATVAGAVLLNLAAPAQAQREFGTPRAYLDVYPGMPQKGASAENVFGTSLTPIGGNEPTQCGSAGTIMTTGFEQPDIVLNVTEPTRVEIFLAAGFMDSSNIGMILQPKDQDEYACVAAPFALFGGFTPAFSGTLPVGEYGVWLGPLNAGSTALQGGFYLNVYEP